MRLRKLNIITDDRFYEANIALKCLARKFIKNGGKSKHFQAIEAEDLTKLSEYFSRSDPTVLLHETYYNIIYYFGTRGREWYRNLKVSDFIIEEDSEGSEIVKFTEGKIKNVGNQLSRDAMDNVKQAVTVSSHDKQTCLVKCLKMYIDKRARSISATTCQEAVPFFLKPKKNFSNSNWYCEKQPLGVNTIGRLMSKISKDAFQNYRYQAILLQTSAK